MPKYRYRATSASGKNIRGELMAGDEHELYERLKTEEIYLISAKEIREKKKLRVLKARAIADFCRELGTLLGAGVSLVRALNMVAQNTSMDIRDRANYMELLRMIRQGQAISDAMDSMGGVFPPMLVYMFRAAETAGNLDQTAIRMADYYTKEHRMNEKVKGSMAYPKFLAVLIVVVVAVLVGYVLPQFESLFEMMDELPLPTRMLYGITGLVSSYWYLMIAAAAALFFLWQSAKKIESVRYRLDRIQVKMPVMGILWQTIYTARFARALSSLYSAGIPIVTALKIARNSIGNSYIERQFDEALSMISSGGNLSDAIQQIDGFVSKLEFSVRVGEETGSLDVMLNTIADDLEYDSEQAIAKMVSYLEPVMIIIMALIVGFIMIAVMVPIWSSYNAMEAAS